MLLEIGVIPGSIGSPEAPTRVRGVPAYAPAGRAAAPPHNGHYQRKKAIFLTSPDLVGKKGRSGRKRTPEVSCERATGACRVATIIVHASKCLVGLCEAWGCWRRRMLRACTSRQAFSHSCT